MSTPGPDVLRRELAFREERGGFSLTLKRNCSATPSGMLGVFAGLACAVLLIGAGFALAGAWLVLPFAGLEIAMLGAAFVFYARRAADYERIEMHGDRLTVEVGEAERKARIALDARNATVRVQREMGNGARVWLACRRRDGEQEFEIGRHLDAQARIALAAELSRRLQT